MGRSAKELCAMLITRSLGNLDEDEEEIVVDYLEDLGISVDIDTHPKDLCVTLLEKTMVKELGRKVPLTAYANSVIKKEEEKKREKKARKKQRKLEEKRKEKEQDLKDKFKKLPGCIPEEDMSGSYPVRVNEEVGIQVLPDNTLQYSAVVSIPSDFYQKIYNKLSNPVLEFNTFTGKKAFARINSYHEGQDILISPLVANILGIDKIGEVFLRVCSYLPSINHVKFTYYGNKEELEKILPDLTDKLPQVINAFSYLSLGIVLKTLLDDKEVLVRVDKIEDSDGMPVFAGLIPFGESDISFEIEDDD